MASDTLLKIVEQDNGYDVLCSIRMPGYRYPGAQASYVTQIRFELNGNPVSELNLGPGMSANPLTGIHLASLKPEDRISVLWIDSGGRRGQGSTTLALQKREAGE